MSDPVTFQNTWKTGGSGFDFGFDSSGFYTGKVARGPDMSVTFGLNDEVIGGTTGGGSGGAAPADFNRASSTYGKVIPLSMGRRRMSPNIIWASAPRGDATSGFIVDFAVSWGYNADLDPATTQITNLYANGAKLWDGGVKKLAGGWSVVLYRGTTTQTPDPTIQAAKGVGDTSAYRGQMYGVFKDFPLASFANSIPGISAEIMGEVTYPDTTAFAAQFNAVRSNGNMTATALSSSYGYAIALPANVNSLAKLYCEFTIDAPGGDVAVGVTSASLYIFAALGRAGSPSHLPEKNVGYYSDGSVWWNNIQVDTLPAYTTGDVISVAYDRAAGLVWFRKNGGAWNGNPAAGTGGAAFTTPLIYGAVSVKDGAAVTVNFGGSAFAYTAPVDYTTWAQYDADPAPTALLLTDFIARVAEYSGLDPLTDLTFEGISDEIAGGILTADTDFGDFVRNLGRAFGFDIIEGETIKMRKAVNGVEYTIDGDIPGEDLLLAGDVSVETTWGEDDAPTVLKLGYIDQTQQFRYNYQPARRILYPIRTTQSRRQDSFSVPVVIDASRALSLAGQALYREAWKNVSQTFSTSPKYIMLEPGDVRTVTTIDGAYTLKVDRVSIEADMRITVQASNLLTDQAIELVGDGGTPLPQYDGTTLPSNESPPVIDILTPSVGDLLTATPGIWTGSPTPTITGEWQADGVPISGATALTYTLLSAEIGKAITYTETAINSLTPVVKSSAPTALVIGAPVNVTPVAITGLVESGFTLTAVPGVWAGYPAPTFAYQWKANSVDIPGATASTYLLTSAEIGDDITVVETADNGVGSPVSETSASVGPVASAGTAPSNIVLPPTILAGRAHVIDTTNGWNLYGKLSDSQAAAASLAKMATGLILSRMKGASLASTVTVVSGDLVGGATMSLTAGDVVSYQDLLYGLFLPSGNDAATAIARNLGNELSAGGGVTRFVTEMNALATELGLTNTVFMNASGLDATGYATTARDMAILAEASLLDPIIGPVADSASRLVTITGANARTYTVNHTGATILTDTGVVGGKTGNTTNAAHCLAIAWQAPGGHELSLVVMGSSTAAISFADMRAIIAQLPVDFPYLLGSASDTTPVAFSFADVTNATISTQYTSNEIQVTGITTAVAISITGGTYSINGGTYTSSSGTVGLGDKVTVRATASALDSTATNVVLTIGGVSDTYTVTTAAPTVVTDPSYASVVFLSSFDGTDAATTATEAKGKTLSFVGNAQIDTAQSVFGGASLLVDGTGDQVTAPGSTDFQFDSGQFTVEGFVRLSVADAEWGLASVWSVTPTSASWALFATGGQILFRFYDSAGTVRNTAVTRALTASQWYHLAADRDAAGKVRLYIDGVMVASATFAQTLRASAQTLWVGGVSGFPTLSLAGHIDEVRITKGVARYGSDSGFTVPTVAYPRS